MKTAIRTILCAVAVVMAAVSCQKSAEPVQPAEEGKETIDICVNGLMGEYTQVDQSKAQLVNNVRVSWEGDEIVYVFDGVKCLGSLAASLEGTEDRYAVLSTDGTHTVSTPAAGTTTLTLVYSPLLTEAPAVSNDAISISLASQSGEKAPFVAYATLNYTSTTITNAVVPFKFATSVIKVNCTGLKPGTAITSATLSNVNTECKLTIFGDKAPVVAGGTNGTITRTDDEYFAATNVNSEGEAVFQIAVPKLETASGARVLTVAQSSDKVKDKKFTTKSLNPATSVNTVCQLVGLPAGALKGEFSVGPNATDKVHFSQGNLYAKKTGDNWTWNFYDEQYIFLAANMAVSGSSSDPQRTVNANETEIDLFTWGYGTWSTSPNGTDYQTGDFTDWGSQIGDGNTWSTLSTTEWQYLFNTRTDASNKVGFATVNNVHGIIILPDTFTDPMKNNGSTAFAPKSTTGWSANVYTTGGNWEAMESAGAVFLPAAGRRISGSNVKDVGDRGRYWSSTAFGGSAYYVDFTSSSVNPGNFGTRSLGCSVRLITESN